MANVINFIQTNAADELISKVLTGKTLNFTRMAVGDGFSYDMNVAKGFTTLVNEVLSLDITKKETLSPSSVKITSAFKNTDAQKEFYYREVGLYAQDPDTGEEVLYAYGNRNDAAELITPAGSNIVTKQLIFIISVGDSANVTFNVNADVYALQEDMLNVQADIEQIQSDLGQAQTDITTLQTDKANKNLNNTGMITNCLLEVPQNIKLELSDGTLTLKAGSKVYYPNGFEADGTTLKFDEFIVNNDVSLSDTSGLANGKQGLFYIDIKNAIHYYDLSIVFSGNTAPTSSTYSAWYDTLNNKILETRDAGLTWENQGCLPLCIFTSNGAGIASIDQIFNGFGYLGSTVFVLPGVKGLIPNGRNPDGTLKNIEIEINDLHINGSYEDISRHCFLSETGDLVKYGSDNYFESDTPPIFEGNICRWFDTKKNLMFITEDAGNNWLEYTHKHVYIGELIKDANSNITSFKPKTTFQAVDRASDKSWLSGLSMPSEKYIDFELGASDTKYTAPANGYFVVRCSATSIGYFILYNVTTGINEERQAAFAGAAVTPRIEARKGDVVQIVYNLDLSYTKILRFYYAQGEVE